ncbi:Putative alpha-1,2-mannosidase [Sphingomonas paucimobilis]|nr:Putative alpha-1,2-mannosidase [Sphingomonas paucimobilis]
MTMRGMILVLAMLSASASAQRATVDEVDPFIGTSGEGHTFPGAVAPFGMVQLSPDTDTQCALRECYGHAAGYRHDDPTIEGFSHTHFSGAGHSDLGDLLVMPVSGDDVPMDPGTPDKPGYRSPFRHATEVTRPGYYAVTLDRPGVRAELTAATRAGVHRYSFPADKAAHLVIDLRSSLYNYPGKILWSGLRLRPDGTLTGFRETRGWAPGRKFFFAMRFSAPLVAHALVNREADIAYKGFQGPGRGSDAVAERLGRALMARLDFGKLDRPLEVKVAISGVDEAGAIANLDSEPGNFDAIRNRTNAAWTQALGAIELEGPAPMRRMVATALYHSLLAPSIWSDSDGRYRGPDDQVHRAQGFTFRSTFSLWDTFRAEHPLLTLIQPEKVNAEIIQSLIASRENSPDGILPVWQFHGRETWTMIGYHAVPVIADAYMKGIRGYDADAALDAMVASARYAPYGGLGEYMKRGYVPIDREPEAASKTVEYAYDDWAIAHMAAAMDGATSSPSSQSARATGATASIRRPASCAPARPTAVGANRSILPRSTMDPTIPRAMPGNIAGSCRTIRPDCSRRWVATRRWSPSSIACSTMTIPSSTIAMRGYCGPDRPIYSWQRTQPPCRLSLQLCRAAMADAGTAEADRRQPVQAHARWPVRQ